MIVQYRSNTVFICLKGKQCIAWSDTTFCSICLGLYCVFRPICQSTFGKYRLLIRSGIIVSMEKCKICSYKCLLGTINTRSSNQGPAAQSIVSLTSSLMTNLLMTIWLTVVAKFIFKYIDIFAAKMWVAFAMLIFSAKKYQCICHISR